MSFQKQIRWKNIQSKTVFNITIYDQKFMMIASIELQKMQAKQTRTNEVL